MAWLPFEDAVAGKSEELVLKYNPEWDRLSGRRDIRSRYRTFIPDILSGRAEEIFDVKSAVYKGELEWTHESLPRDRSLAAGRTDRAV